MGDVSQSVRGNNKYRFRWGQNLTALERNSRRKWKQDVIRWPNARPIVRVKKYTNGFRVTDSRHADHTNAREIFHFIKTSVRVWTGLTPLFPPKRKVDGWEEGEITMQIRLYFNGRRYRWRDELDVGRDERGTGQTSRRGRRDNTYIESTEQ